MIQTVQNEDNDKGFATTIRVLDVIHKIKKRTAVSRALALL